jgi:hypothetical protein
MKTVHTGLNRSLPLSDDIEQMRRLKPLEQLVLAKSALLLELEGELESPGLSVSARKLIETRIAQIRKQTLEITRLIRSLECQLPPVQETHPAPEKAARKRKTRVTADSGPTPSPVFLTANVREIENPSSNLGRYFFATTALFMATLVFEGRNLGFEAPHAPASLAEASAPAPLKASSSLLIPEVQFQLDASDAFKDKSLVRGASLLSQVKSRIENSAIHAQGKIEVEVHSVIPAGSERNASNLKFHRKLTQARAESLVRELKSDPRFQSFQFKAIGKGADERIGRKAVFRLSSGS